MIECGFYSSKIRENQYKYADGNWQKIVSLEDLENKDSSASKEAIRLSPVKLMAR